MVPMLAGDIVKDAYPISFPVSKTHGFETNQKD